MDKQRGSRTKRVEERRGEGEGLAQYLCSALRPDKTRVNVDSNICTEDVALYRCAGR